MLYSFFSVLLDEERHSDEFWEENVEIVKWEMSKIIRDKTLKTVFDDSLLDILKYIQKHLLYTWLLGIYNTGKVIVESIKESMFLVH